MLSTEVASHSNMNEQELCKKRLLDLSKQADIKGIVTFSDFLNLNELNIFALRDLARKTGVSSPTSKKKEVLIKEIVEIVSGKKEPQIKTKQGRPPKTFGYSFTNVFDFGGVQTLNQKIEESTDCETKTVAEIL